MSSNLPPIDLLFEKFDLGQTDGYYHIFIRCRLTKDEIDYIREEVWVPIKKALSQRKAVAMTITHYEDRNEVKFSFYVDSQFQEYAPGLYREAVMKFVKSLGQHTVVTPDFETAAKLIVMTEAIVDQLEGESPNGPHGPIPPTNNTGALYS